MEADHGPELGIVLAPFDSSAMIPAQAGCTAGTLLFHGPDPRVMPTRFATPGAVLPALLVCLLAGCDATTSPTSVRGMVSYRGTPIAGAVLVFAPDKNLGNDGPPLRAETRADGGYTVSGDGAAGTPSGWYRVTIMALEAPAVVRYYGQPSALPCSWLPDKYRDPELSGLSCEIQAARDNVVNFNLN